MKKLFTLIVMLEIFFGRLSLAQNTFPSTGAAGIGTASPNASSLLDITSTSKGMLAPRMTKTQRDAIATPATGLLIFQTNSTPGFYYYSGTAWTAVSSKGANTSLSNLVSPTAVDQHLFPGTTGILDLGSSILRWRDVYPTTLKFPDGTTQTTAFTPYASGTGINISGTTITNAAPDQTVALTPGTGITVTGTYPNFSIVNSAPDQIVALTPGTGITVTGAYPNFSIINSAPTQWTVNGSNIAYSSGDAVIHGITVGTGAGSVTSNTASGLDALYFNTTGFDNTANGYIALYSNTTGSYNTANGVAALQFNTTGNSNTANGLAALYYNTTGSYNTATGNSALLDNTTGSYNTAYGYETLGFNTIGSYNTATGNSALLDNTTGSYNTATGNSALLDNTTGSYNTAYGYNALQFNTTGSNNTANGIEALYFNTTGGNNTANGYIALQSNTTGGNNTANGIEALYFNTTGFDNTADGVGALLSNSTGSSNVGLGYNASVNSGGYFNSVAIGSSSTITASNQVRIGNSGVTSIGGYVNWSNISDGRVKRNIKQNVPGLAFINKLQPITYNLDLDAADRIIQRSAIKDKDVNTIQSTQQELDSRAAKEQIIYTGFIAQDVEKAAKEVNYDFSGIDAPKNDKDLYALRYSDFVVPLVKAVQELDQENGRLKIENSELSSKVDTQQMEIENLKSEMNSIKSQSIKPQSQMNDGFAELKTLNSQPETILGQNIPNPFDNSTLIPFRIPKNCHDASIMITNISSAEVVSVLPISCNEDHVQIDAGTLSSGSYSYSLFVDGKMIDTKQMVIQK